MSRSYRRRGQKPGSTAIPFLITVLISLFVFGSTGIYFYRKLTAKTRELQPMQSATTNISDEDINTILFVLQPNDTDRLSAVMMFRFDPVRKQEFCIGIPLNMKVKHEGREMSVGACLSNHGAEALRTAVGTALDQEIDRYMMLNSDGFQAMVNLIGNVSYTVPIRDKGLRKSDTSVMLDNTQFETMLTSHNYSDELERSAVIGHAVSQLLNQCDGKRVGGNMDSYFNTIINQVTTDITAMDYNDHRHAITYVFQHAQAPARAMAIVCDAEGDFLIPNKTFIDNLKISFYQRAADGQGGEEAGAEGEAVSTDAAAAGSIATDAAATSVSMTDAVPSAATTDAAAGVPVVSETATSTT